MDDLKQLDQQIRTILQDLLAVFPLQAKHLLVIGTSTSEVIGEHIGTAGSEQVAQAIFEVLSEAQKKHNFQLAFQCCEHLNRAIVVERATQEAFHLDEVTVIPVAKAGGSMAAYAYKHMKDPVVVESIQAHAGIDIGDTFIGMHLKPIAVPVRPSVRSIGNAHVTMAYTRPKLIGGSRAVYPEKKQDGKCE